MPEDHIYPVLSSALCTIIGDDKTSIYLLLYTEELYPENQLLLYYCRIYDETFPIFIAW